MSFSIGLRPQHIATLRTRLAGSLALAVLATVGQQVLGFAELSSPQPGEVVSGLVTLRGTADHPAFDRFEVSFAYADDDTGTWFPIGEPVDTRVIDGRLALWDTESITDGDYTLRLQVWLQDGRSLEALAAGVRVRNYTPGPTPIPQQGVTAVPTQAAPTPSPIAGPAAPPADSVPPAPNPFWTGAIGGAVILVGLAAYASAAPAIRNHLARLRMRQVHQRLDRARSRGSRR